MPKPERITPILAVQDVEASIAYYMERARLYRLLAVEQLPTFGGVSRDGIEIFFCKDGQGSPGTWMSVWVDDVDALYEEFGARGAAIRQSPTTFAWAVREMNVGDPDGYACASAWGPISPTTISPSLALDRGCSLVNAQEEFRLQFGVRCSVGTLVHSFTLPL
jgi:hypothetical protein